MLGNQRTDCIQYTRLLYSGNWKSLPLTPTDMGKNPGIGLSHYSISLGLFQDPSESLFGIHLLQPSRDILLYCQEYWSFKGGSLDHLVAMYVLRGRQNQGRRRDKMSPTLSP